MTARISLEKTGEDETLLRYTAEAEIGGKLASVGSRLVQSVAKKSADDFFAAFSRQLTGQSSPAGALPEALPSDVKTPLFAIPGVASFQAGGGLGVPVPAWLVVFGTGLGAALGYCLALLVR